MRGLLIWPCIDSTFYHFLNQVCLGIGAFKFGLQTCEIVIFKILRVWIRKLQILICRFFSVKVSQELGKKIVRGEVKEQDFGDKLKAAIDKGNEALVK